MSRSSRLRALLLAAALPGAVLLAVGHGRTQAAPPTVETGFADVNGIRLFYRASGRGEPVLLLHGGLSDSRVWRDQLARLAEHHRVILVDSRGQGRSTRDEAPITYDLMADDVVSLLDRLRIGRAALVGWSDGGIIGLDIAIRHPGRLSRLFVQAANASPDGVADWDPSREDRPELRHYESVEEEIEALWANEPNFSVDELAAIDVPTAIAIGENDEAITREHTEYLAATIPNARLLILPDVGHAAPIEDPDGYADAVLAFLDAR